MGTLRYSNTATGNHLKMKLSRGISSIDCLKNGPFSIIFRQVWFPEGSPRHHHVITGGFTTSSPLISPRTTPPRDHLGRFVAIGRRQQDEGHHHGDQPGEGATDLPQQQAATVQHLELGVPRVKSAVVMLIFQRNTGGEIEIYHGNEEVVFFWNIYVFWVVFLLKTVVRSHINRGMVVDWGRVYVKTWDIVRT